MDKPKLHLTIMTPRSLLYDSDVFAISAKNSQGNFDILPQHANFITLIENQPVTIRELDGQQKTFNIRQAIIYSSMNMVSIYAEPNEAID